MARSYLSSLRWWERGDRPALLRGSEHSVERECLRVDRRGQLSLKQHPEGLGSALMSPLITTDFSEAQLELVTPHYRSEKRVLRALRELHTFVESNIGSELIWPSSMPCVLPDHREIPIAAYGSSYLGKEKVLYRKGLVSRYGDHMQMLSGLHYNFSLGEEALRSLHRSKAPRSDFASFRSECYLHLLRNFLRFGWLNTYLFGATPAADSSYLSKVPRGLQRLGEESVVAPYATSLRMSPFGYYSRVQEQLAVSFNSVEAYVNDLRKLVDTRCKRFAKISAGEQMNDAYLQIEAEHYSRMRPKPRAVDGERPLDSVNNGGIIYVETRSIDLSPFSPLGVELEQLQFLHLFLLYCLMEESPSLTKGQQRILTENQAVVALKGRKPGLLLSRSGGEVALQGWGNELIDRLEPIADLLGAPYQRLLPAMRERLSDPSQTPSGKLYEGIKGEGSYQTYTLKLARAHSRLMAKEPLPAKTAARFAAIAADSLRAQERLEVEDDYTLPGHGDMELSTQMVIREALDRDVAVEILDREEQILRLSKGVKQTIVKQATYTERDSQVAYFLMENKRVCKQLMAEAGLNVPKSEYYLSIEAALAGYKKLGRRRWVVKPTHANYGDGITFVTGGDPSAYEEAVRFAFSMGSSILVEEFCPGKEYRFLVIDGKVEAICHRRPASVIGDGKSTVRALVRTKNRDPHAYKGKYPIRMGRSEEIVLQKQMLTWESIPARGRRIYLRENSNVSQGGDSIDCTGKMPKLFEREALRAAKLLKTTFCGVDMMIVGKTKYNIIELNFNPALSIHRYSVEGENQPVERATLDALGF